MRTGCQARNDPRPACSRHDRRSGSTTPSSPCRNLLTAFFASAEQLLYAVSADGLRFTNLNGGKAVLASTPTLRDPFINRLPDGSGYALVATDGQGFGDTPNILTWRSTDLINGARCRLRCQD